MKREGRQHGMVRSFLIVPSLLNPNSQTRVINKLDTPPTAGLFTKVPTKPTNHSKFTGGKSSKWSDCHINPSSCTTKSKDKTKGTAYKLKFSNNYVDSDHVVLKNCYGFSATGILHLLGDDQHDDNE